MSHTHMKPALFTLCLMAIVSSAPAQTSLLTLADFESNDLSQLGTQQAQADSLSIVTSPVRAGKYAVRTLLPVIPK